MGKSMRPSIEQQASGQGINQGDGAIVLWNTV
jgi:hypothetical protein